MKKKKNKGWYCPACGKFNGEESKFCLYCGAQNAMQNNMRPAPKKQFKGLTVALGIVLIALIGASVFVVQKYRSTNTAAVQTQKKNARADSEKKSKEIKEKDKDTDAKEATTEWNASMSFSKQSSEDDGKTKTANAATTSAASATTAKSEEASQAESAVLEGVADSNTGSYSSVTDLNNYKQISIDGKFTFAYPKGFFQKGSIDGDNYSFWAVDEKNNECTMNVKVLGDGNSVQEQYDNITSTLMNVNPNIKPNKSDSGWTYTYFSGYLNQTRGQIETDIIASDGNKTYMLEVQYIETDLGEYVNEQGYMMDCIYRYCNRSGSKHDPRTYQDFIETEKE
mgnify:FL=1